MTTKTTETCSKSADGRVSRHWCRSSNDRRGRRRPRVGASCTPRCWRRSNHHSCSRPRDRPHGHGTHRHCHPSVDEDTHVASVQVVDIVVAVVGVDGDESDLCRVQLTTDARGTGCANVAPRAERPTRSKQRARSCDPAARRTRTTARIHEPMLHCCCCCCGCCCRRHHHY